MTITQSLLKGIADFTQVAEIPTEIQPVTDMAVRMPINENMIISNIGTNNLTLWVSGDNTSGELRWSTAVYLANK